MQDKVLPPKGGKPFTDLLGELENGQLLKDLTAAYYAVANACRDTLKPGSVGLKITLTPNARGTFELDVKLDKKVPEHDRPTTTFFITPEGALLRNDPNQPKLPFAVVPKDETDTPRRIDIDG